jgi:hypothetical protein
MYYWVIGRRLYHLDMSKFTISERAQLKEVCKETLIRKFTQKEAHIYVNSN